MNKLLGLLDVFRKGSSVADPALWKKGGEALKAAIVVFVLALQPVANAFGYNLHIDEAAAYGLAAVAVWVAGLFFTVVTSDKVGILPTKPGTVVAGEARGEAAPAATASPNTRMPSPDPAASIRARMDEAGGP